MPTAKLREFSMKLQYKVENLGSISRGEFQIGGLTVMCGLNNTGKSYVNYATYGHLKSLLGSIRRSRKPVEYTPDGLPLYYRSGFLDSEFLPKGVMDALREKRTVSLSLKEYARKAIVIRLQEEDDIYMENFLGQAIIGQRKKNGTRKPGFHLANIEGFAQECESRFSKRNQHTKITISSEGLQILLDGESGSILIETEAGGRADILASRGGGKQLAREIHISICDCIFRSLDPDLPKPFIVSAERTGASIFQRELDFSSNRLVEVLKNNSPEVDPYRLIGKFSSNYPLPVRDNVDTIREQAGDFDGSSYIGLKHPDILQDFDRITGGKYEFSQEQIFFRPAGDKKVLLSMTESSSMIRSLLLLWIYLTQKAQKNNLLMMDEPEMNLHPHNQRLMARLLVKLVNAGINVFITTHSDYIIKEFNILIALNTDRGIFEKIREEFGYSDEELLSYEKVKAYTIEETETGARPASDPGARLEIHPLIVDKHSGIEARGFDKSIREMNRIQDEVIWS